MTFKILAFLLAFVGICNGATVFSFARNIPTLNRLDQTVITLSTHRLIVENGFFERPTFKNEVSIMFLGLDPRDSFAGFAFMAPDGEALHVGKYDNVGSYPFADPSKASMSFSNGSISANIVGGNFTILELSWGEDGFVSKLAVDFLHLNENRSEWWSQGSLRYNSDIPLSSVPEPSCLAILGLTLVVRRKR